MSGRRWAYVGALVGIALSVAGNVGDVLARTGGATPPRGAVIASAAWPVLVLLALEIAARVDWPAGWRWSAVRWGGLAPVGAVAAIVSYRHLSGLLALYGEDPLTAALGPLAVDGLMVLAAAALLVPSPAITLTSVDAVPTSDEVTSGMPDVSVTSLVEPLPALPGSVRAQVEWLASALKSGRQDWRQHVTWSPSTTERRIRAASEILEGARS